MQSHFPQILAHGVSIFICNSLPSKRGGSRIKEKYVLAEKMEQVNLQSEEYREQGLYLIFPDLSKLFLTKENIEKAVKVFWEDATKIPPQVKMAADFQRCPFCPLKQGDMCDAIRPTIPFLDEVDKYTSMDKVIAVFRDDKGILYVSSTTMQNALKYVSILSLMQFCKKGRTYWKYFLGIHPLMTAKEMAIRFYLNVFFFYNGDKKSINKLLVKFKEEIGVTSKNQVKRLGLVCKNDAVMNAFVNTQAVADFISLDVETIVKQSFEKVDLGI